MFGMQRVKHHDESDENEQSSVTRVIKNVHVAIAAETIQFSKHGSLAH